MLDAEQVRKLVQIRDRMGLRGPSPACDIQSPLDGSSAAQVGTASPDPGSVQTSSSGTAPDQADLVAEVTRRVMEALRGRV